MDQSPGAAAAAPAAGGSAEPPDGQPELTDPDQVEAEVDEAAAPATGWQAVLGEEFNWYDAVGGRRGMVESVAPGLVFVVTYVIHPTLWPALIGSLGVALVLAVLRLVQRGTVMGALSGLGGIVIGAIWAATTGRAENVYAWGLWVNGAWLAGCLLSIVIRWPVAAVVVAVLKGQYKGFRQDQVLMQRGYWVTWLLAGLFGLRLAVQLPFYFQAQVAWLGAFKLAMGLPLFALVLWIAWWWMRPAISSQAPAATATAVAESPAGAAESPAAAADSAVDSAPDSEPDVAASPGAGPPVPAD